MSKSVAIPLKWVSMLFHTLQQSDWIGMRSKEAPGAVEINNDLYMVRDEETNALLHLGFGEFR